MNNGGMGGSNGPLMGSGFQGDPRRLDGMGMENPQPAPTRAQADQAYNDLMRDLGQAQQLDPKKWGDSARLSGVINGQILTAIDQVELLLRRKLDADGSVRSASPRNTPPGYANAVAEYYKRLSKQ
jgi:hypothetical protein